MNKTFLSLVLLFGFFVISPSNAKAYDDDTHFWLTYYLARKVGYSQTAAEQIASACVSVDYDADTEPVLPKYRFFRDYFAFRKYHQRVRTRLHALVDKSEKTAFSEGPSTVSMFDMTKETNPVLLARMESSVDRQQEELWKLTLQSIPNPGVFLHYVQDRYAHKGFSSLVGHGGYFYVDHLGRDKANALTMVRESLAYLLEYKSFEVGSARTARSRQQVLSNPRLESEFDWKTIEAMVEKLSDANPSPNEIKPNDFLLLHERKGDKGIRQKYRLAIEANKLLDRLDVRPAPHAVQKIILDELNEESYVPTVWLYSLKQSGRPAKMSTKCTLGYRFVDTRGFFEPKGCESKTKMRFEVR